MHTLENYICSYKDIRSEILSFLSNKDINKLLSINKKMYNIKQIITFTSEVNFTKELRKLNYFDSFTNIHVYDKKNHRLPKNIKSLTFDIEFDEKINHDTIPHTVNYLSLRSKYSVYPGYIPKSVTTLFFYIGQEIIPGTIPDSVTELFLNNKNLSIVVNSIPESVVKLNFNSFNQPISPGLIPKSVKYLDFGYDFNQKILPGTIPESVVELNLGWDFNQELIYGSVPTSIKKLKLGWHYNKNLTYGSIPFSVKKLCLESYELKIKPGDIPFGVTKLKFCMNQKIISGLIPDSVTHLKFGIRFENKIEPNVLPASLLHLTFGNRFNKKIKPNTLPDAIQYLVLGKSYDKNIKYFPRSLIYLSLGKKYFHKIDAQILTLRLGMPHIPNNYIPESVIEVILKSSVTYLDDNSIPANVKYLKAKSPQINIFEFINNISNLQILKIHLKIIVPKYISKNIQIKYYTDYSKYN